MENGEGAIPKHRDFTSVNLITFPFVGHMRPSRLQHDNSLSDFEAGNGVPTTTTVPDGLKVVGLCSDVVRRCLLC
jgi:hypothetical protein